MTDDTWHQDAETRELSARFDKHGVILHKMGPARFQLRGVVDDQSYGDFVHLDAVKEHADVLDKWAEAREKDATLAPPAVPQIMADPAPPQKMADPATSEAFLNAAEEQELDEDDPDDEELEPSAHRKHGRRRR
jgi:hypothetical protein